MMFMASGEHSLDPGQRVHRQEWTSQAFNRQVDKQKTEPLLHMHRGLQCVEKGRTAQTKAACTYSGADRSRLCTLGNVTQPF